MLSNNFNKLIGVQKRDTDFDLIYTVQNMIFELGHFSDNKSFDNHKSDKIPESIHSTNKLYVYNACRAVS